jgi:hypothetical protein
VRLFSPTRSTLTPSISLFQYSNIPSPVHHWVLHFLFLLHPANYEWHKCCSMFVLDTGGPVFRCGLAGINRSVKISTMSQDRSSGILEEVDSTPGSRVPDDCVSGKGEEVRLRALKLYVVRSAAERHGGTMEVDLVTDTVNINVPKREIPACTEEIAKLLGAMYRGR